MHIEWKKTIKTELHKPYMRRLYHILQRERSKYTIHPIPKDTFAMFKYSLSNIKVVLLGQDPYPSRHAHGIAFSSKLSNTPHSLMNIFEEVNNITDLREVHKLSKLTSNNLYRWCNQGVFLLNTSLTVRNNYADSHSHLGWNRFTQEIIRTIDKEDRPIIYVLLGTKAHTYSRLINHKDSKVIKLSHPSPNSVNKSGYEYDAFKGSKIFEKINEYIEEHYNRRIRWDT